MSGKYKSIEEIDFKALINSLEEVYGADPEAFERERSELFKSIVEQAPEKEREVYMAMQAHIERRISEVFAEEDEKTG